MARTAGERRNLVIVMACVFAGLVFFIGGALALWEKNSSASRQAALEAKAPNQLIEGTQSGLFTQGAGNGSNVDITEFHPAYLLGAISRLINDSQACDGAHVRLEAYRAICEWSGGVLRIDSNTMSASVLHRGSNTFTEDGRPIGPDSKPLSTGSTDHLENRAYIYYKGTGSVADRIIRGLTSHGLSEVAPDGSWFPARLELGFRSCFSYKTRSDFSLYCYAKS